jgi:hypothetical protein
MDPRIDAYAAALDRRGQTGQGFDFPVFVGKAQYGNGFNFPVFQGRAQYGQGFGDVLRGIWNFFRPVVYKGAQTLLKTGADALQEGVPMKEVLRKTIQPTLGAVVSSAAGQVLDRLSAPEKPAAAPQAGVPIEASSLANAPAAAAAAPVPVAVQRGTGRGGRKRAAPAGLALFKAMGTAQKKARNYHFTSAQRQFRHNF